MDQDSTSSLVLSIFANFLPTLITNRDIVWRHLFLCEFIAPVVYQQAGAPHFSILNPFHVCRPTSLNWILRFYFIYDRFKRAAKNKQFQFIHFNYLSTRLVTGQQERRRRERKTWPQQNWVRQNEKVKYSTTETINSGRNQFHKLNSNQNQNNDKQRTTAHSSAPGS